MKKKNRVIIGILLTLVLVLSGIPDGIRLGQPVYAAETSGTCGETLTWTLNDGTLTISGTGSMYDFGMNAPAPWDDSKDSITHVVIGEDVTSIGERAFFGCHELTGVEIPDGVMKIGSMAFASCYKLAGITIPSGITTIETGTFSYCYKSLTSVEIPDGVETIAHSAFEHCESLNSVIIPASVTNIGLGAFSGCENLRDVYYAGTQAGWEEIDKASYWIDQDPANIYYMYSVTAKANPAEGGTTVIEGGEGTIAVRDGRLFLRGGNAVCTMKATPNEGYRFVNWTEGDTIISEVAEDTIEAVTQDLSLTANFELNKYAITVRADPEAGGTVSGGGTYTYGQQVTLTATPKKGYTFDYWSLAGSPYESLSRETAYEITVTGAKDYAAHFRQILIVDAEHEQLQSWEYTGNAITFPIKVYLQGIDEVLAAGTGYEYEFSENVDVGKGKIKVTLTGNREGSAEAEFEITPADISSAKVEAADQEYDGTKKEPVPTVTWGGKAVAEEDYTPSYTDNVRAGTATVTVSGKHNFKDTTKADGTFEIKARPLTITADSAECTYDGTPLTADGFSGEGLADGDQIASAKVEGTQTEIGSSANTVSQAKIVNAAGEDVTDCYAITYQPGTLTVKAVETFTLTFDLGGGTLNGKTGTYTIECEKGETIHLPDAPTKEGFRFLYWKGSRYEAGAEYTVTGPHDFTAVWEKAEASPKTGDDRPVMLWTLLLGGSLLAGILLLLSRIAGKKDR